MSKQHLSSHRTIVEITETVIHYVSRDGLLSGEELERQEVEIICQDGCGDISDSFEIIDDAVVRIVE